MIVRTKGRMSSRLADLLRTRGDTGEPLVVTEELGGRDRFGTISYLVTRAKFAPLSHDEVAHVSAVMAAHRAEPITDEVAK